MNTTNYQRFHDASNLVRFAIRHDPDELYRQADEPRPSRLAGTITHSIQHMVATEKPELSIEQSTSTILENGIRDTQTALAGHIRYLPDIRSARRFVADPRTIRTIAVLALRSEEEMSNLLSDMDRASEAQKADQGLSLPSYAHPPHNTGSHCPAAEFDADHAIMPIFNDFVVWSGELAILAMAKHGVAPQLRLDNKKDLPVSLSLS